MTHQGGGLWQMLQQPLVSRNSAQCLWEGSAFWTSSALAWWCDFDVVLLLLVSFFHIYFQAQISDLPTVSMSYPVPSNKILLYLYQYSLVYFN